MLRDPGEERCSRKTAPRGANGGGKSPTEDRLPVGAKHPTRRELSHGLRGKGALASGHFRRRTGHEPATLRPRRTSPLAPTPDNRFAPKRVARSQATGVSALTTKRNHARGAKREGFPSIFGLLVPTLGIAANGPLS